MPNALIQSVLETPIAVLGAGSWGTALAVLLANNGQPVRLWGYDPKEMQQMARENTNSRYLPGIFFPSNLALFTELSLALDDIQDVLIVVPSRFFVDMLIQMKPHLSSNARVVWGSKGLTAEHKLLHTAVERILEQTHTLAVLSGPSFAMEVARGLPTAVTIATTDMLFAKALTTRFNSDFFRVYTSDDMMGVEVCGVVKNVLAIAAGILDGLQLGANALSALITRGLVEMKRLGLALGGKSDTFTGLAGLGDLVLSCTDNQSRNRRFGSAIASGKSAEDALQEIGQAIEGYYNLEAVYHLAQQLGVSMPITEQVYQIIYQKKSPKAAMLALLSREPREEVD